MKIAEAQTQMKVRERLRGRVPVPEVFAWAEDEGQGFIYMSLVEGETLQERWGNMNELERQAICVELKLMAKAWRTLTQDGQVSTHPTRNSSQQAAPTDNL